MSAAKSALQIDEEFLDDLASRFIINVPVEEVIFLKVFLGRRNC